MEGAPIREMAIVVQAEAEAVKSLVEVPLAAQERDQGVMEAVAERSKRKIRPIRSSDMRERLLYSPA